MLLYSVLFFSLIPYVVSKTTPWLLYIDFRHATIHIRNKRKEKGKTRDKVIAFRRLYNLCSWWTQIGFQSSRNQFIKQISLVSQFTEPIRLKVRQLLQKICPILTIKDMEITLSVGFRPLKFGFGAVFYIISFRGQIYL